MRILAKNTVQIPIMVAVAFSGAALVFAQTSSQSSEGAIWNEMLIRGNLEGGWRSRTIGGSEDLFRSHLNLGNGLRLFDFFLEGVPMGSSDQVIDGFRVSSTSFFGEPAQRVTGMVRKRGTYQLNVDYREQKYFFLFPSFADPDGSGPIPSQHRNDNKRRSFDVNLAVTPKEMRLDFGYSRSTFNGPAFSTWDFSRDEFMIFAPLDRTTQDFRVGWSFTFRGVDVNLEQTYRDYKSEASANLAGALKVDPRDSLGNNRSPTNRTKLFLFDRLVNEDGGTPVSRVSLHTLVGGNIDLTGRYVYSRGKVEFNGIQYATGLTFGNLAHSDTTVWSGDTRRPSHLLEFGGTYEIDPQWRVSDQLRFHKYSITGASLQTINQREGAVYSGSAASSESDIDLTNFENRIDADYLLNRRLTIRGGYRFSSRKVAFGEPQDRFDTTFTTHTFLGSLGYRAGNNLSAFLEYQNGKQDNSFTRIEPLKFQVLRLRSVYRASEKLTLSGALVLRKSDTPNPDTTENKVKFGTWGVTVSYTPLQSAYVNVGYNRQNIESETDIRFFSANVLTRGVSSYGFFNNNFYVDGAVTVMDQVRAEVSYSFTEATRVSNFPTRFVYFRPRVSVKVIEPVWASASYFFYRYDERNSDLQDYEVNGVTFSSSIRF